MNMSRFIADTVTREGETLVVLADTASGATLHLWPALGNNAIAARLAAPDGRLVDLLLDPPTLDELRAHPSWWGVPLLFPFPSRVPRGEYVFDGRRLRLRRDFHGFALDQPWKVVAVQAGDDAATVQSRFDAADHPDTLDGYPFPYRVDATYRLDAQGIHLRVEVTNTGSGRLPFGYGAHPYFRLPLGPRGSPGACLIQVPAARRWNLPRVHAVSDGVVAPWEELCEPVRGEHDLRQPTPLAARTYDGVYTELALRDGLVECIVLDPANGLEAVMRATPNHPNVTVYTPPGRAGVCFEPWTCPPNVFNLAAHGVRGHGLVILAPGERWEGSMWLLLRPAAGSL